MTALRSKTAAVETIDLEALAKQLAPLVVAKILQGYTASLEPYSTRKGREPEVFRGRTAAWRQLAPTIPGALAGGRWTIVPRAAFDRWLDSQSAAPAAPAPAPAAWSAEATLALIAGGKK